MKEKCQITGCRKLGPKKLKLFPNKVNGQYITFFVCEAHYETAHPSRKD